MSGQLWNSNRHLNKEQMQTTIWVKILITNNVIAYLLAKEKRNSKLACEHGSIPITLIQNSKTNPDFETGNDINSNS